MNALKLSTIHNLALHCGYPTQTTKIARLEAAASYWPLLDRLASFPTKILSIDVGIKNFSYCKLHYGKQTPTAPKEKPRAACIDEWNHINLHDRFGPLYVPQTANSASPVDSKAYLAHLALSVVDSVLSCPKWTPSVITIENQRTRSNSNSATLPNVLLNFTLEHMIYAAFAARQMSDSRLKSTVVMPMNANKMVNFWLTRFIAKSKISPAQSKLLRTNLLYGWLSAPEQAPFALPDMNLPPGFGALSARAKTKAFLDALSLDSRPNKVDDLVDCALYNLAFAKQLEHHQELRKALREEEDVALLVKKWDLQHCGYLEPVLRTQKVALSGEYLTSFR